MFKNYHIYYITTGKVKKLVPNNYEIHYRNLQQCLELAMKLKKIHRLLKFKQKDWMKPHIDFNTERKNKELMKLIRIILN